VSARQPQFSQRLLDWFDQHGRRDLPWQRHVSPYRVWVSEIMLQQTQVATVIPYYTRFMERFETVEDLAEAPEDEVLHHWTGLGYYARARNLHETAQRVVGDHGGNFPTSVDALCKLPGIGLSTAGAIAAIAFNKRAPILDGNVKRVLTRYHEIAGWPEQSAVKKELWQLADSCTPYQRVADYTQAIMDLGATVCTRSNPDCPSCPLQTDCLAHRRGNTGDYPGRKTGKPLPVKKAELFIVQNSEKEILLQKRPASGIWGGLWSFPETGSLGKLTELCAINPDNGIPWQQFRHTFSHYHLEITPIYFRTSETRAVMMEANQWLWYNLHDPPAVGLAAPVKRLINTLSDLTDTMETKSIA
jgi:A/G-specific adenine glycosylase